MSKVNILSPELVSKIAAGEIIERPASVVKELVENSLDAGADKIDVTLKDAGKTLIQIKDNGSGIEKDDLEKIFLRHATSKISDSDDLFHIHSLGFRGEALYSIAAVADVRLQSKTADQDSGWEIHMRGGAKQHVKPCPFANTGTHIEINELFFNTPARKKFLKTNTTEINQILNVFIPYTLLHNQARFSLTHQGRSLLDLAPTDNLKSRVTQTLNLEEKFLLEGSHEVPSQNVSIKMILGDINITRSRRDMQFIFVNGRPVQNKSIAFHMNQIYRLIIPGDVYPFFAVSVDIPSEEIDVNIHPTKREIKIKDERAVCSLLRSLCEQTLMSKGKTKQVVSAGTDEPARQNQPVTNALRSTYEEEPRGEPAEYQHSFETPPVLKDTSQYSYPRTKRTDEFFIPENTLFEEASENLHGKLENARYLGTFHNKYHLLEFKDLLFIVDQHAAQERINYEKLLMQMEKGKIESQRLLTPVLIKLSPQEINTYDEVKDKLDELGFESNLWDKETLAVHSYPILIQVVEKSVRELLTGENILKCDHDTVARRACRESIMAGEKMTKEQVQNQIKELTRCLDPFTCPHGRPTTIEITEEFLNKQFLRT